MAEALHFEDISRREVPVTFVDGRRFTLQESTEGDATEYRNTMMAVVEMTDGKVSGMSGGAQASAVLVSKCLFEITSDEDVEPRTIKSVPVNVINKWAQRIVRPIFETLKEISELDEPEGKEDLLKQQAEIEKKLVELDKEEPAKNVPSTMLDTSE